MKNREIYAKDPLSFELLNNGVSRVAEIGSDQEQLKTLRFELENFVCDGEYARGLDRILTAYLDGLSKPEQQAAWVSGFFGSGKSHLVKMLRYLWEDFKFADGASARSIVNLPQEIQDLLIELTNRSRRYGGTVAIAGTLGAGHVDNVRLAFMQLVFRAVALPENYAASSFALWLREKGLWESVESFLLERKLNPAREVRNFYVSTELAEALAQADPSYGSPQNAQEAVRSQFPAQMVPTVDDVLQCLRTIFAKDGELPSTLLVVDEVQQFIGDKIQRAMDVQEIVEHCCKDMDSRVLFVGTGQSSLTGTASLSRLQARFAVTVSLSDTDVENVIRKTVLAKKPERTSDVMAVMTANEGEICRHLDNTRLAATPDDKSSYVPDYPLLPVRRRFWERVLRNVDVSGTKAQLRTQLKIVFDAARETAERPLGVVVPADFMYDQIATDLLNTGMLQREYHEIILGYRDMTPEGELKSRLCALMLLISKLPRSGGADDLVRARSDTLADLMVEDLKVDGPRLRQQIPGLLEHLVNDGRVMLIEDEYCLQTREGAAWTHEFNSKRAHIGNDEARLNAAREEHIAQALTRAFQGFSISHGSSREPRQLEFTLSNTRPAPSTTRIMLWIRHGWSEDEKTVIADARAAGTSSPVLFGFLPRVAHDELRQNLAAMSAAQETLDMKGTPNGTEAEQAAESIRTQLRVAETRVQEHVGQILSGAKVFLGGGNQVDGLELRDRAQSGAESALQRLFPQFGDADHSSWPQVLSHAKGGHLGALESIGYRGETVRHPVCKQIYDFVGSGKKGREVREHFKNAPFGWPQDAIDASLVILGVSGNLRAEINGQGVDPKTLNQTQISNAKLKQDIPPLAASQRLDLKALFQKLGVTTESGKESAAAAGFLAALMNLAQGAGGDAPLPEPPSAQKIRDLQSLSGNAQLLAIHKSRQDLEEAISDWTKLRDTAVRRLPVWKRCQDLLHFAQGLAGIDELTTSIAAIETSRGLLSDPDPAPPLAKKVSQVLRDALNENQKKLASVFDSELKKLQSNLMWKKLTSDQQTELINTCGLQKPPGINVASEDGVLKTLREKPLADRQTLLDALPVRFQRALVDAAKLLEPRATKIALPAATIKTEEELEKWIDSVRAQVKKKLKDGPVIL